MTRKQLSDTVLMVEPRYFYFNAETAVDNAFQQKPAVGPLNDAELVRRRALGEFTTLVELLRKEGVQVLVAEATQSPSTPDAVFPNNWFSTHEDGTLILYPMFAKTRRAERRRDIILDLERRYAFWLKRVVDYSEQEEKGAIVEGTGSLIFDHEHALAYACLSERTHPGLMSVIASDLGYEPIYFSAVDKNGRAVYHTNVLMSVGESFVILCEEALPNAADLKKLRQKIEASGKELIPISLTQMSRFAGNLLQVQSQSDTANKPIVMSTQAFHALSEEQRNRLRHYGPLVHSPLETIETLGGGSARCMLAEIALPKKAPWL